MESAPPNPPRPVHRTHTGCMWQVDGAKRSDGIPGSPVLGCWHGLLKHGLERGQRLGEHANSLDGRAVGAMNVCGPEPAGEPSGSSPSVKKAAFASVNAFHWAGTSSS